jgi:very-short-patch-repair endonuclease
VSARTPGAIHTSERSDLAAKRLRRNPTFVERELWKALRGLEGVHFRRQAPIGPYVVDFACHRARLIVEIDGGVHDIDTVAQRDAERDEWLRGRGYRVLRLKNAEVIANIDAVVCAILANAGADTPTPDPFPQGEGE